jgi:hypothetical protein
MIDVTLWPNENVVMTAIQAGHFLFSLNHSHFHKIATMATTNLVFFVLSERRRKSEAITTKKDGTKAASVVEHHEQEVGSRWLPP